MESTQHTNFLCVPNAGQDSRSEEHSMQGIPNEGNCSRNQPTALVVPGVSLCVREDGADKSVRSKSISSIVSDADSAMFDTSCSTAVVTTGEQEYETQFLGFAPKSFCDGLYNAVLDYTWEYFRASQDYIQSEFPSLVSREDLDRASKVFLSKVSQSIDKAFDKFETYILTNIMCVPNNIVLPEDQIQKEYTSFTKTEEQVLDEEIIQLKERIIAVKYVNATLRQEYKQIREVQKEYSDFLELLQKLKQTVRQSGVVDTTESLIFAVDKSNKLIGVLEEMQKPDACKRSLPDTTLLDALYKRLKTDEM